MRITDITTTQLFVPDLPGFKDATIRHQGKGRGALPIRHFVNFIFCKSACPENTVKDFIRFSIQLQLNFFECQRCF